MLNNFTLDIDAGELTLTFSEPVSAETFEVEGVSIQASNSTPTASYQLTSDSSTSSENGVEVVISLSDYDLNQLKASGFASSDSDTFLTLTSSATRDIALIPNQVMSINSTSALSVQTFTADDAPPQLQSFTLDLTEDTLEIVFDEPIDNTTIDFSQFTLTTSSLSPSVHLSGANITSTDTGSVVSITVALAPDTIVAIKSDLNFGTETGNTYLRIAAMSNAVTDTAMNVLTQSVNTQAADVLPDTTNPLLTAFTLNLESDTLELTFDDVIDPSMFDPTGITLQGSRLRSDSNAYYTLISAELRPELCRYLTECEPG